MSNIPTTYSRREFGYWTGVIRAYGSGNLRTTAEQALSDLLEAAHTDALELDAEIMSTIAHAAHDAHTLTLHRVLRDNEADALVLTIVAAELAARMDALHSEALAADEVETFAASLVFDEHITDVELVRHNSRELAIRSGWVTQDRIDAAHTEAMTDDAALRGEYPCEDCDAFTAHPSNLCTDCRSVEAAYLDQQDTLHTITELRVYRHNDHVAFTQSGMVHRVVKRTTGDDGMTITDVLQCGRSKAESELWAPSDTTQRCSRCF